MPTFLRNAQRAAVAGWTKYCERRGWTVYREDGLALIVSDYADGWMLRAVDQKGVIWAAFQPTPSCVPANDGGWPTSWSPVPLGCR